VTWCSPAATPTCPPATECSDAPSPTSRSGINLRALAVATEVFGVPAEVTLTGDAPAAAGGLLAALGPGSWSSPPSPPWPCERPAPAAVDPAGFVSRKLDALFAPERRRRAGRDRPDRRHPRRDRRRAAGDA